MVSRRDILKVAGLALCSGAALENLGCSASAAVPSINKVPFGAAVSIDRLYTNPTYTDALLRHCALFVGEGGMKWFDLRPSKEVFQFDAADKLVDFAINNKKVLRGHTLVWYGAMPEWTKTIANAQEAEHLLVQHIETVMGRYRGKIHSWDVINEPLVEVPRTYKDLRQGIFQQKLGDAHLFTALKTAAHTDPTAKLVINEYDIEFVGAAYKAKRNAFRDLIRSLLDQGAPLHGIGLQGHLRGELEIDKDGLSQFVADIRAMGLEVSVTELDVIDNQLPALEKDRDAMVAQRVRDFLSAIFASATPTHVLTWGITDAHTWVPMWYKRRDGLPNRPLPLDFAYREKPFMSVLREFCAIKS